MFKCCVCNKKANKEETNNEISKKQKKSKQSKINEATEIENHCATKKNDDNGKEKLSKNDSGKESPRDKPEEKSKENNLNAGCENDDNWCETKNNASDPIDDENKASKDVRQEMPNLEILLHSPHSQSPNKTATIPHKNFLYGAAAYIERTIDDGPEEEGDDSVFEAGPPSIENNLNKKSLPGVSPLTRWLSQEETDDTSEGCAGMQEPPATPVAKDELALRRHRFFSDLLEAAQNTSEHRVRFDPLGPTVHAG